MHSFYSTRPTQPYDYSYLVAPTTRSQVSATRMHVLTIERRKKSALFAYFLRHPYRSYMIAFAVAVALSASTAWAADFPEIHQQGDVTYVSGGIGDDETEALAVAKKDYNLHLTSTDSTGHYLGGSRTVIRNGANAVLIDVVSHGPLFYAHLPSGRYSVESFNGDQSKKKSVNISSGKAARVNFTWPASTVDAYTAPAVPLKLPIEPTIISPNPITTP